MITEVGLYFEYKLYRGNRTTKISAEHFNAFTSPNYPFLIESGVHLKVNKDLLLPFDENEPLRVHKIFEQKNQLLKIINKKPHKLKKFSNKKKFIFVELIKIKIAR